METTTPSQMENNLTALKAVLPDKGRVLILPHNYPDPDALAAAGAIELLLAKRFHLHGQIAFTGVVSRAENRELLRHFRYKWRYLYQVREPAKGKLPCIFADTAPWSGNVTVPSFVRPVAVFDHHPMGRHHDVPKTAGLYVDLRAGAGASASILYEYLEACEIAIPKWLATIMAYAIATETMDLSMHTTDLDLRAYHSLLARANMSVLGEIRHAPLPRSYYSQLQEAMQNAWVYGRVAWSHLDDVRQPEIISEIADLLLRAERITWSFCTAFCGDDMLISLRSSHSGARCGSLIKRVIGANGSAGGHNRMAAGFIDLHGLNAEERAARRTTLIKALLSAIERRPIAPSDSLAQLAKPLVTPEIRAASPDVGAGPGATASEQVPG